MGVYILVEGPETSARWIMRGIMCVRVYVCVGEGGREKGYVV